MILQKALTTAAASLAQRRPAAQNPSQPLHATQQPQPRSPQLRRERGDIHPALGLVLAQMRSVPGARLRRCRRRHRRRRRRRTARASKCRTTAATPPCLPGVPLPSAHPPRAISTPEPQSRRRLAQVILLLLRPRPWEHARRRHSIEMHTAEGAGAGILPALPGSLVDKGRLAEGTGDTMLASTVTNKKAGRKDQHTSYSPSH